MWYKLAIIILALLVVPVGTAWASVVNGGFETGDFTGWTQSGDLGFTGVSGSPVHSGSYAAYFGPIGTLGYISQSLSTTATGVYDLSFWLRNSGSPSELQVWWDGGIIYDQTPIPDFDWTNYTFTGLVASSASTDLQFGFRNDPSFAYLDDVAVDEAGSVVPEPASLCLLGMGLGLGGLFMRRRKQQV